MRTGCLSVPTDVRLYLCGSELPCGTGEAAPVLPLRVLLCQSLRQLLTVLLFRRLTLLRGLLYLTKERRCSAECVCERRGGEGGEGGTRFHRARAVSADDGITGVFNKTFIGVLPGVTALAGMAPLRVWDSVLNEIRRALIWTGLLVSERQVPRRDG